MGIIIIREYKLPHASQSLLAKYIDWPSTALRDEIHHVIVACLSQSHANNSILRSNPFSVYSPPSPHRYARCTHQEVRQNDSFEQQVRTRSWPCFDRIPRNARRSTCVCERVILRRDDAINDHHVRSRTLEHQKRFVSETISHFVGTISLKPSLGVCGVVTGRIVFLLKGLDFSISNRRNHQSLCGG